MNPQLLFEIENALRANGSVKEAPAILFQANPKFSKAWLVEDTGYHCLVLFIESTEGYKLIVQHLLTSALSNGQICEHARNLLKLGFWFGGATFGLNAFDKLVLAFEMDFAKSKVEEVLSFLNSKLKQKQRVILLCKQLKNEYGLNTNLEEDREVRKIKGLKIPCRPEEFFGEGFLDFANE